VPLHYLAHGFGKFKSHVLIHEGNTLRSLRLDLDRSAIAAAAAEFSEKQSTGFIIRRRRVVKSLIST
jgi:hypothetical protein